LASPSAGFSGSLACLHRRSSCQPQAASPAMTQRWADMMSDDEDMQEVVDRRLLRLSTSTSYAGSPVPDFDAPQAEGVARFKRSFRADDRDHSRTPPRQLKREGAGTADLEPASAARPQRFSQAERRGAADPVTPQDSRRRGRDDSGRDQWSTPQRAVRHTRPRGGEERGKMWRGGLLSVQEACPAHHPGRPRRRAGDIPEVDDSTWEHRISQREKQIRIGKDTPEYALFRKLADTCRRGGNQPLTPDPAERVSKRLFDSRLKRWRIELHNWRPENPEALAAWEQAQKLRTPSDLGCCDGNIASDSED